MAPDLRTRRSSDSVHKLWLVIYGVLRLSGVAFQSLLDLTLILIYVCLQETVIVVGLVGVVVGGLT